MVVMRSRRCLIQEWLGVPKSPCQPRWRFYICRHEKVLCTYFLFLQRFPLPFPEYTCRLCASAMRSYRYNVSVAARTVSPSGYRASPYRNT